MVVAWRAMSYDEACYYWVVICRNHKVHNLQNQFFGHKILLAETDAFSAMPALIDEFTVRCDDCGREYSYKAKDVQRLQSNWSDALTPHPMFL